LSRSIDADSLGVDSSRKIENGVRAMAVEETVRGAAIALRKIPDDLPLGIDPGQSGAVAAWRIDRRIDTPTIEKAAMRAVATKVIPNDLPLGIDGVGRCLDRPGYVESSVGATAIKEAMIVRFLWGGS
jgi:hypothetical protein